MKKHSGLIADRPYSRAEAPPAPTAAEVDPEARELDRLRAELDQAERERADALTEVDDLKDQLEAVQANADALREVAAIAARLDPGAVDYALRRAGLDRLASEVGAGVAVTSGTPRRSGTTR